MALHYGLEEIKDWEGLHNTCRVKGDDTTRDHPLDSPGDVEAREQWIRTETIIFASMNLGFSSISERNLETVCIRFAIYQDVFGALLSRGKDPLPILPEHVIRRIGLWTNASTLTDAAWRKRVWERLEREHGRNVRSILKHREGVPA